MIPVNPERVKQCQALFQEALKRYVKAEEAKAVQKTWPQVIQLALVTLQKNGFTEFEIRAAMAEQQG
jgi:uncharacterized pyridoxamine 5'-phosphate oxidase family protein